MRIVMLSLLIISFIHAADTYNNSVKREVGTHSMALGGISTLSDIKHSIKNPAISSETSSYFAFTKGEFSRENYLAGASIQIKRNIFFNTNYSYSIKRGITLYNSDGLKYLETYNDAHSADIGVSYWVLHSKKWGLLKSGLSVNIYKESIGDDLETENRVNGANFGLDYLYSNIEVSASVYNFKADRDWAYFKSNEATSVEKLLTTQEIPVVGSIGAKYKFLDMISLLAEMNIEDIESRRYNDIYRTGIVVDVPYVNILAGYGDEKLSFGAEYRREILKKDFSIVGAIETAKIEGVNFSIGTRVGF